MTSIELDPGTLEIKVAKDLMVIKPIQRRPTEQRVRKLSEEWDDSKVGILQVAKITDGEYKGKLHIYDGGTRWKAKMDYGGELYPFACWVRSMTVAEAAQKFLDENSLSQKPSAFARYSVGVRAGKESALAVQKSLGKLKIEASDTKENSPNIFTALAAAERIVTRQFGEAGDWHVASDVLAWCLDMARRAYPLVADHPYYGHDADLLQGLFAIQLNNPDIPHDTEKEANLLHSTTTWLGKGGLKERLYHYGDIMTPSHWRVVVIDATKQGGGSSSRGYQMGRQIALNYNQKLKPLITAPAAAPKRR